MSNSSQQCWSSPTRSAWHNTVPMRAPSRKLNMICSRATCWLCHGGAGGWSLHVAVAYSHGKGGCDQQGETATYHQLDQQWSNLINFVEWSHHTYTGSLDLVIGWKLARSTWMQTRVHSSDFHAICPKIQMTQLLCEFFPTTFLKNSRTLRHPSLSR
jgi:hypothetical protein